MQQSNEPPTGPGVREPLVRTSAERRWSLDLALIGNCAIGALIDAQARIVWCCMPRFDGEPVFHALLGAPADDPDSGEFRIDLEGLDRTEQAYDPGTAILRTRL